MPFFVHGQSSITTWDTETREVSFLEAATQAGIDIASLQNKSVISRYDVARILNAVECKDCINPWLQYIENYTEPFWSSFVQIPGKYFDDINYLWWIYNGRSYYYCVASVAEKQYMFWYPELASPVCPWLFCGSKSMTKAEFIQVILNILANYINKNYSTNRKSMKQRIDWLDPSSYAYTILNSDDINRINSLAETCSEWECEIKNWKEFHSYLKYCMFNIEACNMQPIWRITEAYWPIAELNIAIKEWIIDNDTSLARTIHEPIDGDYAIQVLSRVFPKIACNFDYDYDCDGVPNKSDNCPNTYNPNQKDTDGDKLGDVCDNDIDNDSITNPIGIVDALGSMNIRLRNRTMDNCLTIQNKEQSDSNRNNIGDACDLTNKGGLAIETSLVWTGLSRKLVSRLISSGAITSSSWTVQDSISTKNYQWTSITIPLWSQWANYKISAQINNDVLQYANQTLIVPEYKALSSAKIALSASKNTLPLILSASLSQEWAGDNVNRIIKNGTISKTENKKLKEEWKTVITTAGEYTIQALVREWDKISAIAEQHIVVDSDKLSIPNTQLSNQTNKNIPTTLTTPLELKQQQVNRGDGTHTTEYWKKVSHTYTRDGTFVIQQKITLLDGWVVEDNFTITKKSTQATSNETVAIINTRPEVLLWWTYNDIERAMTPEQSNDNSFISSNWVETSIGVLKPLSYQLPNLYYPQQDYIVNQCQVISNQSTLIIQDDNLSYCLRQAQGAKLQCDFDKDWVDDRCDDDIDGDGVKNIIWLIKKNNPPECLINLGNIDTSKIKNHFQGSCALDNCPLITNTDQKDTNGDFVGDICKALWNVSDDNYNDKDGDWLIDSKDSCPEIKETYNWYKDTDWCPELWKENICQSLVAGVSISIGECRQCPCQYVDQAADIKEGDTVRASLRSISWTILQSWSENKDI